MKVYKFILSALLTGLLCSCQNGEIIDPLINPEKTGYTFDYWYYLDADGSGGSFRVRPFAVITTQD
jgi:hypothetical protein